MKKKILPRILILLTAATLLSAVIMSSIFAKYVTSESRNTPENVRPASFNVVFDSLNMDAISADFAMDEGGVYLGTTVKRISYPVTVTSTDSEAAANVTIKLSFNSAMTEMINKARYYRYYDEYGLGNSNARRISCDFKVYRVESDGSKTALSGSATALSGSATITSDPLTWTSTTQSILDIGETHEYVIEFLVYHDDNKQFDTYSYDKGAHISDAVTIDVIATQVDPMN